MSLTTIAIVLSIYLIFSIVYCQVNYETLIFDNYNVEYIYESLIIDKVKGVVFLAHGCHHRATDWWIKSSNCSECIGLPIQVSIVSKVISHGYIPLAMSSTNKISMCWSKEDIKPAFALISHIYNNFKLNPSTHQLYMIGSSSGGGFVRTLSNYLISNDLSIKVSAISIQNMPILDDHHTRGISNENRFNLPPIAIVYMERDVNKANAIVNDVKILSNHSIPVMSFKILQKPLDYNYFNKFGCLSQLDSKKLVESFIDDKLVSIETRELLCNPRECDWRNIAFKILPNIFPSVDSLIADKSCVSEVMNVAYAYHEMTNEHIDEILNWFAIQRNPY